MSKRIVVIGGGFAGLRATRNLAKRPNGFKVILVDSRDQFTFSPWLIDGLAGTKQPKDYTIDFADAAQKDGFTFIHGTASRIDRKSKMVEITDAQGMHTIGYDCLIDCPGAKTAYYNIPGAKDYTFPLKTADDVVTIHQKIDSLLSAGVAPSVVIVGAGPSGIESLFALRGYLKQRCEKLGKLELYKTAAFSLVQGGPQILPGFPNGIVDGTMRELGVQGYRVYLGEPVSEVSATQVMTSKGSIVPSQIVIWCAGIEANLIPMEPAVVGDRAGYAIDRSLSIEPMVFSGGDAANYKESNVIIPKNAQTAMPMGLCLAENAARACQDLPPIHFQYTNRGNLISLGNTGFLDLRLFTIKTSLVPRIREWLYQYRFKQMSG